MAGRSADQITEWEGGSLSELVAMLQAAALPVRIEVIAPGAANSSVGEVHLLAGGMADAFAGSLRRDDAMAALQRLEGARFVVESRLPNPETGSLSEPGPHRGNLKDRHLASLMRYCEDYVLSCRLEVWRGQDRAVISYRRGEIIGTIVGGSDESDRLPEVLGWTDGSYEIILPAPVLPQLPSPRKRETQSLVGGRTPGAEVRPERKRHTTLPMAPAAAPTSPTAAPPTPPTAAPPKPSRAPGPATSPPPGGRAAPIPPARPALAAQPVSRPPVAPPATPARPASASRAIPPQQPSSAPPKPPVRPIAPAAAQVPALVVPSEPLQTELTTRGNPPVPPVPLVPPRSAPQPVPRAPGLVPALPASAATPAQAKVAAPVLAKPLAKPAPPTAPATAPTSLPSPVSPPAQSPPPAPSPPAAPVRPSKPAAVASNDLKPTSGTIDAKPKHAAQHPPPVAPIEVADQPVVETGEKIAANRVVPARSPRPRRRQVSRKGLGEHPIRIYVFVGLAVGVGIVLAYWAYWYLPFGHN